MGATIPDDPVYPTWWFMPWESDLQPGFGWAFPKATAVWAIVPEDVGL